MSWDSFVKQIPELKVLDDLPRAAYKNSRDVRIKFLFHEVLRRLQKLLKTLLQKKTVLSDYY
jgi:hypothetical protein